MLAQERAAGKRAPVRAGDSLGRGLSPFEGDPDGKRPMLSEVEAWGA
jgi:hypothetical protein